MGDIIDLHERLSMLEMAHNEVVRILIEKKVLPETKGEQPKWIPSS